MFGNRRKAFFVSAALVSGAMLMTACQDTDTDKAADTDATQSSSSATSATSAPADSSATSTPVDKDEASEGGADSGSGVDTGDGKRVPVEQTCGANDISWSTKSETQAGGYILVMAKAKSGITCYLPAALPTVAFGSDGTQAGPAEQSVGEQIKLSGSTTAYAGVNPKSSNEDGGKELDSIIVGVGDNDPNPVSLPVDTITVSDPIVTNWHTAPTDAVPFS
ncbi:DUF4232 domain-containing protein [Streptomyces aurantiacus]|uniref:DUF4232 domain-containing protein n=1 Tax=Streptomyces aurantiacus TaxID=47760 RepID=A0A7G1P4B3_9ACTN|nr:DUF4232 domain-containing protein [Streptomyces aurantiacus]BCL29531.1 hypothetical protein GCM10017557_43900 [Streptomyces aurantiacus]